MSSIVPAQPDFTRSLEEALATSGFHQLEAEIPGELRISDLRRGRRRRDEDPVVLLTLKEVDGVLAWEEGAGARRSGRRAGAASAGEIISQYKFERLPPSEIPRYLASLDAQLTPHQGLRRWKNGAPQAIAHPEARHRALLIVHGAFSNSENTFAGLGATKEGRAFLKRAEGQYDEVLSFDHPTLSVSPVLNALDLACLFLDCPASVDLICHSRGGLIARWWLEALDRRPRPRGSVVLLGAPLSGTSLAAPPRLRASLDFLTNVARALSAAGDLAATAAPLLGVVTGILRVIHSVTAVAATVPLIDAAVAMIPGIAAMSRVGNNFELQRLRRGRQRPDYFAVTADFRPRSPGWKFWEYFVELGEHAANLGADLVFDAENDLVIDTASMSELDDEVRISDDRTLKFGRDDQVHHTIYFRQPRTIEFIRDRLGV